MQTDSFAQTSAIAASAAEIIQQWQSTLDISLPAQRLVSEVKLVAGTPIEVEVAYTINSKDVKRGGDAVLHEGRRFAVAVGKDTLVKVTVAPQ